MGRRFVGASVLVLVLAAAVVVGHAGGRERPGRPTTSPLSPPPAVGACLLQPVSRVGVGTAQDNQPVFPTVSIGHCSGRHFGEVVAVVDRRLPLPDGALTVFEPYERWCAPVLSNWTGGGTDAAPDLSTTAQWTLAYRMLIGEAPVFFAGPDDRQRAAGQRWVACVAVPQVPGDFRERSTGYQRSIHNGFARQPSPPGLALCWKQQQPTYDPATSTDCTGGHRVEVLGHEYLGGAVSSERISVADQRSCVQFAAKVTGMADPTAGGRLTVSAQVAAPAYPDAATTPEAWCVMSPQAASEHLVGPLLGLGDGAVPLR